jgi:hypothetical protein
MKTNWRVLLPALGALLGAAACADNGGGRVGFAVTSRGTAALALAAGDTTVIALGTDTIILRGAQLVLRKIELKKVEAAACDSLPETSDCEEFEVGTTLVSLPLGATAVAAIVTVNAPAGRYDELEFKIHRPDASKDAAFLALHPEFTGVSIRVTGTYSQAGTRSDFTFTSDLDASQEMGLDPPISVANGSPLNVTLRVDVATWFLNGAGTALVNPASANKGQPNAAVVQTHITASLKALHDDNEDGRDDDHEGS